MMGTKVLRISGVLSLAPALVLISGCSVVADPMSPIWEVSRNAIFEAGTPDLVPLEKVEDEYGSYLRTTVRDFSSIKYTDSNGVSEEGPKEAKEFIIRFIVEEALDSTALDNEQSWNSWKQDVAPKYLHSDYIQELLSREMVVDNGFGGSMGGRGIVLTDEKNTMPTLFRDGSSRSTGKLFTSFAFIRDIEDPEVLNFRASGSAIYPVKDEDAKEYFRNYFIDESGEIDEGAVDDFNGLNDGRDSYLKVDFSLEYRIKSENDNWKIIDFWSNFNVLDGTLTQ